MNLNDQRNDMERLRGLIAAGNAAVAGLDPNLKPEAIQQRTAQIRKDFEVKLDGVLAGMSARRSEAQTVLPRFTQEAVRRRAKFSEEAGQDALIRLAKIEVLKRTPTAELLAHLDDAVEGHSLALAELVRLEFMTRDDRAKDSRANLPSKFEDRFSTLIDASAKSRHAELEEIVQLPEMAIALMKEFRTGVPNPIGRMNAARVMSLGTQAHQEQAAA